MRELRVTSCWFGKTVEEVEQRRFVKLKRCVLEPAARGFALLKDNQQQRFSSDASAATQIQQQHNFSSWRLATQTSYSPRKFRCSRREARFFVQETPPVEIRKDCSCVQEDDHRIPHTISKFPQSEKQQFFATKCCGNSSRFLAKVLCKRRTSRFLSHSNSACTDFCCRYMGLRIVQSSYCQTSFKQQDSCYETSPHIRKPDFRLRSVHLKKIRAQKDEEKKSLLLELEAIRAEVLPGPVF
ncbi:hypothetical protein F511_25646 [Dorcoceras hygrometricum]|uniref:Uncharacterized protein n=1 Tax=Dorcoceras hygrometricum TaxID=472368 RepID=A0A2Z7BXN9_9LAMI|nr:hypothetical protein F511_25646 [Dorcoceras hygrometricum]